VDEEAIHHTPIYRNQNKIITIGKKNSIPHYQITKR